MLDSYVAFVGPIIEFEGRGGEVDLSTLDAEIPVPTVGLRGGGQGGMNIPVPTVEITVSWLYVGRADA